MLNEPNAQSATALRRAVTSPNGTTEAATKVFDDSEFMQIIENAVSCATDRGIAMSKDSLS